MMPPLVILAGGLATRLYPLTQTIPKALLKIAGKPFISHQLEILKKNNIQQVVICAGYLGEQIEEFVKDGSEYGLSVQYSFDGESLMGTGGAVQKALPLLGDMFWIMYGDSYLDADYSPVLRFFLSCCKKGLMTVFKNDDKWDRSNIQYADGMIVKYDKKEKARELQYIDYGLSLLRKEAFARFAGRDVFDLAEVYVDLVNNAGMLGFEMLQRFYEIGSPEGIAETERYIMLKGKRTFDE
jgi:N-acetyl-alpha-D-muramate 1-phosphate uridylyltransferase